MAELMKGHVWHERRDAKDRKGNPIVTYPVYVEDKHDEIRCHVKVLTSLSSSIVAEDRVVFLSYAGKPLANMRRFARIFVELWHVSGYSEFDLGFEVNENFNDSYRWVRSTKKLPDDLKDAKVRFFVFGLPEIKTGGMLNQLVCREEVCRYAADWVSVPFDVPHCVLANSAGEVESAFEYARARGLEGVMVKQVHAPYERKRTDGWLKMKPEDTADGKIVGVNQAFADDGTPHDRAGSLTVVMEDGSIARPGGMDHDLAANMWHHPDLYIGQWVEFKYMERDRQGGYRHPSFIRLREAKQ